MIKFLERKLENIWDGKKESGKKQENETWKSDKKRKKTEVGDEIKELRWRNVSERRWKMDRKQTSRIK